MERRISPGRTTSRNLSVLLYHKVDRRFEWGGTWVTPSQFLRQIRLLLDSGYRFLELEDLLREPRAQGKVVALTFDDGYRALRDYAFPVLREHRIPASVFVVTAFAGKKNLWDVNVGWRQFDHLDWSDILRAADQGIRFYSHTHTHRNLARLDRTELLRELSVSRETIQNRLGLPVPFVSYPFGIYNASVAEAARESGYEAAFTLFRNRRETVDPLYCIERTAVYRIDTPGTVRRKLEGGRGRRLEGLKDRAINWCARGTPVAKAILGRQPRP